MLINPMNKVTYAKQRPVNCSQMYGALMIVSLLLLSLPLIRCEVTFPLTCGNTGIVSIYTCTKYCSYNCFPKCAFVVILFITTQVLCFVLMFLCTVK